jgi:hypothetical protein
MHSPFRSDGFFNNLSLAMAECFEFRTSNRLLGSYWLNTPMVW